MALSSTVTIKSKPLLTYHEIFHLFITENAFKIVSRNMSPILSKHWYQDIPESLCIVIFLLISLITSHFQNRCLRIIKCILWCTPDFGYCAFKFSKICLVGQWVWVFLNNDTKTLFKLAYAFTNSAVPFSIHFCIGVYQSFLTIMQCI